MVLRGEEGGIGDAVGVAEALPIVDTAGIFQSQPLVSRTCNSLFGALIELCVAPAKYGSEDWRFRGFEIIQRWGWELVSYG